MSWISWIDWNLTWIEDSEGFVKLKTSWGTILRRKNVKSQITSTKLQMVRQAHHPEPGRRVNLKFQNPMTKTDNVVITNLCRSLCFYRLLSYVTNVFGWHSLGFWIWVTCSAGACAACWNLFDVWDLLFVIFNDRIIYRFFFFFFLSFAVIHLTLFSSIRRWG